MYFTLHQIGPTCEHIANMEVSEAFVALNVSNSTTTQGSVPVRLEVFGSHTELIFDYCVYKGMYCIYCCSIWCVTYVCYMVCFITFQHYMQNIDIYLNHHQKIVHLLTALLLELFSKRMIGSCWRCY